VVWRAIRNGAPTNTFEGLSNWWSRLCHRRRALEKSAPQNGTPYHQTNLESLRRGRTEQLRSGASGLERSYGTFRWKLLVKLVIEDG